MSLKAWYPFDDTDTGTILDISGNNNHATKDGFGPVAWYDLDGDATDKSGNGHDGTASGVTYVTGKAGQAASFDGASSEVTVAHDPAFSFEYNDPFSISFWVRRNGTQSGVTQFVGKPGPYSNAGYSVEDYISESQIRVTVSEGDDQDLIRDYDYPESYEDDRWCHFVMVYDGSSLLSGLKLYGDGIELSAHNVRNTITGATIENTDPFTIGREFNGLIDEVRIFDYVLPQAEVSALYKRAAIPSEQVNGISGLATAFHGTNTQIEAPDFGSVFASGAYSVSTWFNTDTLSGNRTIFEQSGVFLLRMDGDDIVARVHNGTTYDAASVKTRNISASTWYHVVVTFDGTTHRIYLDGVVKDSNAISGSVRNLSGSCYFGRRATASTERWEGIIDEFRVYDRALTLNEIQELSKALSAHYDFDIFKEPTVNLVSNPRFLDGIMNNWNDWRPDHGYTELTGEFYKGGAVARTTITTDNEDSGVISDYDIEILAGETVTISLDVKAHTNRPLDYVYIMAPTDRLDSSTINTEVGLYWQRVSFTVTRDNDDTCAVLIGFKGVVGEWIEYTNIQVEKKSYDTPFVDGTRDDNIIADKSGHNFNGELILDSTPRWTNDTAMGRGAYYFDGTKFIETTNIINWNEGTISLWVKFDADNLLADGMIIYADYLNRGDDGFGIEVEFHLTCTSTGALNLYYRNISGDVVYQSTTTEIADDTWHHVACKWSYDENITAIYIDGVLVLSDAAINHENISSSRTILGKPASNARRFYDGYITDVQLFGNALSDDEIYDLYSVKARVDSDGSLVTNSMEPNQTQILDEVTSSISDSAYNSLETITGEEQFTNTDVSDFIESDDTLGNFVFTAWVYNSSSDYTLSRIQYTKDNDDRGFITDQFDTVKGWNFLVIGTGSYSDASNTPWSEMDRIEFFRTGPSTGADTTQYITIQDLKIQKYFDNRPIKTSVAKDGYFSSLQFSEVGIAGPHMRVWYPFDDIENGKTLDISGGNHGTLNGFDGLLTRYAFDGDLTNENGGADATVELGTASYDTGRVGQAIGGARLGYSPNVSAEGTTAFWLRVDSDPDPSQAILNYAEANKDNFFIRTDNSAGTPTQYDFYIRDAEAATYKFISTGGGTLTQESWQHFAVSWKNGVVEWYLDGEIVGTIVAETSGWAPVDNQGILLHAYGGPFFIDEFREYDRALSASEIKALYSRPVDPEYIVDGQSKRALRFDGVDDYVSLPSAAYSIFDPANPFSVSVWVKPNSLFIGYPARVIEVGDIGNTVTFRLFFDGVNNEWQCAVSNGTQTFAVETGYGTAVASRFQHVVTTWDGSRISIYLDGDLISTSGTTSLSSVTPNSGIIGGQYNNETADSFHGSMDEMRIYSRALTEAEVNILYTTDTENNIVRSGKHSVYTRKYKG